MSAFFQQINTIIYGYRMCEPGVYKQYMVLKMSVFKLICVTALCDLQFIPFETLPDGTTKDLSKEMLPLNISGDNLLKWVETPHSVHLPPPGFARVDSVVSSVSLA